MSEGDESFLTRWSRRKRKIETERPAPSADSLAQGFAPSSSPVAGGVGPRGPTEGEAVDATNLPAGEGEGPGPAAIDEGEPPISAEELAALPKPEDLTVDADLSAFLRKGVPESLRNAALRRIWAIDPAVRDFVSEACEYAYDWNVPGGVPGTGPLLPCDDIPAMMQRMFGSASSDKDPAPAEAEEVPVVAQGQAPSPEGSEPGKEEAAARAPLEHSTGSEAERVEPAHRLLEPEAPGGPAIPEVGAGGAAKGRRHGGAVPV